MPVAVPIMLHASRLSPVDVSADASAEYTCPMHPEVRQVGPGSCPICGMALEPVRVTLEAPPNHELDDMTRRFRVSLGLSLPILAVMVGDALPGRPLDNLLPGSAMAWVECLLATPVVLWGGWPFFERGWASLVSRHLNMFTLIGIGVNVAFIYSLVAVFAPQIFPSSARDHHGDVGRYFEAAAVIVADAIA